MKSMKMMSGVAAGVTVLALAGTAFAAGSGYVPGAAAGTSQIGGGSLTVVTSQNVGSAGGTVAGSTGGANFTLSIPGGAFTTSEQVTISQGTASTVTGVPSGQKAVMDFSVSFSGSAPTKNVTLVVKNSSLDSGAVVYKVKNGSLVKVSSSAKAGEVDFSFSTDPEFIIAESKTVPGATSPVTGKPFGMELGIGGLIVLAGAGLALYARRKIYR